MITITEKLTSPVAYDLSSYGKPEDILFFDIETTGFSPDFCTVYLIGCVFCSDGDWYLKQFFADSITAEGEILLHFFTMLSKYPVVIHFNGDTFDIPFINKRADKLNIPHVTNNFKSVDIYKLVKPYKNLLGISNCKQKTIELLLGINREDKYNGGQLIEVYKDYLVTGDEEAKRLLLLHNADDLKGMPALLPVLDYVKVFNGEEHIEDITITEEANAAKELCTTEITTCSDNTEKLTLTATFSNIHLPAPVIIRREAYTMLLKDNSVIISINIFTGELKHFYSDYKNYYYLPKEDMAIHKSVAEFVDKEHKKKATAKTCYTKKQGRFITGFKEIEQILFFNEYPFKQPYILINENTFSDKSFWSQYYILVVSKTK